MEIYHENILGKEYKNSIKLISFRKKQELIGTKKKNKHTLLL